MAKGRRVSRNAEERAIAMIVLRGAYLERRRSIWDRRKNARKTNERRKPSGGSK